MEYGNVYGLIRQYVNSPDLIALPFVHTLNSLDPVSYEVIQPEWIDGYYYSSGTGSITSNAGMRRAVIDCSKYDAVIIGTSSALSSGNVYSGVRPDTDPGQLYNMTAYRTGTGGNAVFAIADTSVNMYAWVSQAIDFPLPIIGIVGDGV